MKNIITIEELKEMIVQNKNTKTIENVTIMMECLTSFHLNDWTFENCSFYSVSLENSFIENTTWKNCKFVSTRFDDVQVSNSRFESCEFYNHNSYLTRYYGCEFNSCKFIDVNFEGLIEYADGYNPAKFMDCTETNAINLTNSTYGIKAVKTHLTEILQIVPLYDPSLQREIPNTTENKDKKTIITKLEFLEKYQNHLLWLEDENQGERLDISNCELDFNFRLAGLNLSYANLSNVSNLGGKDIRYCLLNGTNLDGSNLSMSDVNKCQFIQSSLRDTKWYKSKLIKSTFAGCELENSSMANSQWEFVKIKTSNLKGVDFWGAWIFNTNFENVDMSSCNMRTCHINDSYFDTVNTDQMVVFDFHLEQNNVWEKTWFPVSVDPENMAKFGNRFLRYKFLSEVLIVGDIKGKDR